MPPNTKKTARSAARRFLTLWHIQGLAGLIIGITVGFFIGKSSSAPVLIKPTITSEPQAASSFSQNAESRKDFSLRLQYFNQDVANHAFTSPQEAMRHISRMNAGYSKILFCFTQTFAEWARIDPKAALKNVSLIEDQTMHWPVKLAIFRTWYQASPEQMIEAVKNLEDEESLRAALSEISSNVLPEHIEKAFQLAEGLPKNYLIIAKLARRLAPQDALKGLRWLKELNHYHTYTYQSPYVVANWALHDPHQALSHALSIEDPKLRNATLSESFPKYIQNDPEGATQWVRSIKDQKIKDLLIRGNIYEKIKWGQEDILTP